MSPKDQVEAYLRFLSLQCVFATTLVNNGHTSGIYTKPESSDCSPLLESVFHTAAVQVLKKVADMPSEGFDFKDAQEALGDIDKALRAKEMSPGRSIVRILMLDYEVSEERNIISSTLRDELQNNGCFPFYL